MDKNDQVQFLSVREGRAAKQTSKLVQKTLKWTKMTSPTFGQDLCVCVCVCVCVEANF